jgi:uncharacterized protein (TIGR02118 family)
MTKLMVLYRKPADATAFDAYYVDTHVPIAKKIPGLERYEVSDGAVAGANGLAGYHLVATLQFESLESLHQAMESPEGLAAAADLPNFAQAGVEMLVFETKDV